MGQASEPVPESIGRDVHSGTATALIEARDSPGSPVGQRPCRVRIRAERLDWVPAASLRDGLKALRSAADVTSSRNLSTTPSDTNEPATLLTIATAVRDHRPITFSYVDRSKSSISRTVHPHGIVGHSGHWYVIGEDIQRAATRSFRIDRIADVAIGAVDVARGVCAGTRARDHLRSRGPSDLDGGPVSWSAVLWVEALCKTKRTARSLGTWSSTMSNLRNSMLRWRQSVRLMTSPVADTSDVDLIDA